MHVCSVQEIGRQTKTSMIPYYGLTAFAALLGISAASAAQNYTNLCSCTDLLWQPQPSTAWEVINWHSKLVAELNAARAGGVRTPTKGPKPKAHI